jgi:hypothetical protein
MGHLVDGQASDDNRNSWKGAKTLDLQERTAIPMLDAAIASQENDLPRAKPISALSASNRTTALMQSPSGF